MLEWKKAWTAWLVIFTFFFNLVAGTGLFNPSPAFAYHSDDPADQKHPDCRNNAPTNPQEPREKCPPHSPVYLRTGSYTYSNRDLLIPGRGFSLEVTRDYDSQDLYDGPFGHGWKFNYEVKLIETTDESGEYVSIRRGDGIRLLFSSNEDGTYNPPQGRRDHLVKNSDGTFTWSVSGCLHCGYGVYHFDNSGFLTRIEDQYGNYLSFSHDGEGKLIQVTGSSGRQLTIIYGENNKITSIIDPANRIFSYSYDPNGNLTSYTDPLGNKTTYVYDTMHNLTSIIDPRGNAVTTIAYDDRDRVKSYSRYGGTWTYSYDPQNNTTYNYDGKGNKWTYKFTDTGQLSTEMDPSGKRISYVWDDSINLTSITDALGHRTTFQYNERGNITGKTDALGASYAYTYHPINNKLTSITDALGRTTTLELDEHAQVTKIKDPLGNITSMSYDQFGELASTTDSLGQTTRYTYDQYGNLLSIKDALANITRMQYDILGNLVKITDPRGNSTIYTYDKLHNKKSMTNAQGQSIKLNYDENYNIISTVNFNGDTNKYSYNEYNQVLTVTNALGNTIIFAYTDKGYPESIIDSNGNKTINTYDKLGRLIKVTSTLGKATEYIYNSNGNITDVKDAGGHTTRYIYDAVDRLVQVIYPDGSDVAYTYDYVGNVVSKKDRKGNLINYTYNNLNLLTKKSYPDGSLVTYTYDELSRLISAVYNNITIKYKYDALNRITQVDQNGRNVTYEYDTVGNITKFTYPNGAHVSYDYNDVYLLKEIRDTSGNSMAKYIYDNSGRKKQLLFPNGTVTEFTHDKIGRLINVVNKVFESNAVISSFKYSYDKMVNKASLVTVDGNHSYTYDEIYQLIHADYPEGYAFSDTGYNYDELGNRTYSQNSGRIEYTTNNMNQYTQVNGTAYSYDGNGNLTSDGVNSYSYDYENRLIQVKTSTDTITYEYDPFGRRVAKSVNGKSSRYVYDGDYVIEELNGSGVVIHYVYGPGVDEILAMIRVDSDAKYYYHLDGMGSVERITNSEGVTVEFYTYDVFGNTVLSDGSGKPIQKSLIGNSYMFAGRRFESESGLYHFRARYYKPSIGRFLQEDPLEDPININRYTYVGNNPINFTDPTGLEFFSFSVGGYYLAGLIAAVILGIIAYFTIGKTSKAIDNYNIKAEYEKNRKWAQQQRMKKDVRATYPREAQIELDKIQAKINSEYADIFSEQCNEVALTIFKTLLDMKLKHIKIRGLRTWAPGEVHMNWVELVPVGAKLQHHILIYGGPGNDRDPGTQLHNARHLIYDIEEINPNPGKNNWDAVRNIDTWLKKDHNKNWNKYKDFILPSRVIHLAPKP